MTGVAHNLANLRNVHIAVDFVFGVPKRINTTRSTLATSNEKPIGLDNLFADIDRSSKHIVMTDKYVSNNAKLNTAKSKSSNILCFTSVTESRLK